MPVKPVQKGMQSDFKVQPVNGLNFFMTQRFLSAKDLWRTCPPIYCVGLVRQCTVADYTKDRNRASKLVLKPLLMFFFE
jgi:hypothetical protein